MTAEEEVAFIAWAVARHQVQGGGWWRTVDDNGDLPGLIAIWRAEQQPAAGKAPERVIPPWCGWCPGEPVAQRWIEGDDGRVTRCTRCHPDAAPTHADKRGHQPYRNPIDQSAYDLDFNGRPLPGTDTKIAGHTALTEQLRAMEAAQAPPG